MSEINKLMVNGCRMTEPYKNRTYRSLVSCKKLASFRVVVKETDLLVRADRLLEIETRNLVLRHRIPLERYLEQHPEFVHGLIPFPQDHLAPPIVKAMISAGQKAGVGPMAAVAGTIAEYVGRDLLSHTKNVIIENGGDIYIRTDFPLVAAVYAGKSPLSGELGVQINSPGRPVAVCTSSGTLGHSISLGKADAAVVISQSAGLADAAATAIGNQVSGKDDIKRGIGFGKRIAGVLGIVVIAGKDIGFWGDVELVKLS